MELAFEDLCSRFDRYLSGMRESGDRQRGLLILDESAYETSLQKLAINFRLLGTRWRVIQNLAEAPLFISSKVSRAVQLADHIAYAVFRRYNAGDTNYYRREIPSGGRRNSWNVAQAKYQRAMPLLCMHKPRLELPLRPRTGLKTLSSIISLGY